MTSSEQISEENPGLHKDQNQHVCDTIHYTQFSSTSLIKHKLYDRTPCLKVWRIQNQVFITTRQSPEIEQE